MVPEKVWEALVQSQVRFDRVPRRSGRGFCRGRLRCRARSCGEDSEEGLGGFGAEPGQVQGGFGAEPGQVQEGSGEGSGLCLGGFGAGFQLWCRARSGSTGEGLGGFGAARSGSTEQGGLDLSPSFLCGGRTNAMLAIAILRDHRRRFLEKVPGEGPGGFGAEPASSTGFRRRFRRRSGRLWCRARLGSTGFRRRSGRGI